MQAHLWCQDNKNTRQRNDEQGGDASSNNGGGSSSGGSNARVWGTYWTVGPCKRMMMENCGNGKYKWIVTIEIKEAFLDLDASDHNTVPPNMLHLGSLHQTAGGLTGTDL